MPEGLSAVHVIERCGVRVGFVGLVEKWVLLSQIAGGGLKVPENGSQPSQRGRQILNIGIWPELL